MAVALRGQTRSTAAGGRRAWWDHHLDAIAVRSNGPVARPAIIRAVRRHSDDRRVNLIEQRANLGRVIGVLVR